MIELSKSILISSFLFVSFLSCKNATVKVNIVVLITLKQLIYFANFNYREITECGASQCNYIVEL